MGSPERARYDDLYRRAFRPLTAYALRRAAPEDAADVVAETLLVAWRRLDAVPPPPDDVPWLYGVARHVLANQRRSARRRSATVERLAAELRTAKRHTPAPDPTGHALRRLPPDQQELLRLAAWEGLQPRELAVVLGCTPNAASIRLHRARAALRRAMADERIGDDRTGTSRRPADA